MIEFYPQVKLLHVACVIASGSLFALRGALVLAGSGFGNHAALRWLSYAIDTTLLTAACMLMTMLHLYPIAQGWLTAKVVLLVVYIVLGSLALRRAPTLRARAGCFAAAVAVYLFIAGIAVRHDPLGVLRLVLPAA